VAVVAVVAVVQVVQVVQAVVQAVVQVVLSSVPLCINFSYEEVIIIDEILVLLLNEKE
jgi:hypothetical protein